MTGQEQLASETAEKWQHSTHLKCMHVCASVWLCVWLWRLLKRAHTGAHTQMAEEFSRGFDMQIRCWLVISAGCNTVLSFLLHNIRADNIYLKGAVD